MKVFINYGIPILMVLIGGQVGDSYDMQFLGSLVGLFFAIIYLSFVMRGDILMIKGTKAIKKGEIEKGISLYDKAIKQKRLNPDSLIYAPYAYLRYGYMDKCKDALFMIEKKKDFTPSQKRALYTTKGLYLWKSGDRVMAEKSFMDAHEVAKDSQTYSHVGFILMENGKFDEAYEFNKEAMEYNEDDVSIMDNMALSHYYRGEFKEALALYEKIMEKGTTFPVIYYNYALCLEREGKKNEAIENLEKALTFKFSSLAAISKDTVEAKLNSLKGEI